MYGMRFLNNQKLETSIILQVLTRISVLGTCYFNFRPGVAVCVHVTRGNLLVLHDDWCTWQLWRLETRDCSLLGRTVGLVLLETLLNSI